MWCLSIAMCFLDLLITNINSTLHNFLIDFFVFLAWIVLVIGAINTFPKEPYSNKRVWFYYAIMGGGIATICSFIRLISILTT